MRSMKRTVVALALLAGLLVSRAGADGPILTEINLDRHFLDGAQLTGNLNVRYLKATPAGISVTGEPREKAELLVDGNWAGVKSGISWNAGETAKVLVDLQAERLVCGIAVRRIGDAHWEMDTSLDGKEWVSVPADHFIYTRTYLLVTSLAQSARYVRLRALAGGYGLTLREVFIYGERTPPFATIGGIYPSLFPPVAGREVTLRAIIRNLSNAPMEKVTVDFIHQGEAERTLGSRTIASIAPGTAAIAAIGWKPAACEPHKIRVKVRQERKVETIPVVQHQLYFGVWSPVDYEHFQYMNLYAGAGYDNQRNPHEYLLIKLHGGIPLGAYIGPHATRNIGVERFVKAFSESLHGTFRDGISMDEWFEPYPEALTALERVYRNRGNRMIVPWLAGTLSGPYAQGMKNADLVFLETYCNMFGHDLYRSYLNGAIDSARAAGMLDTCLVALGYFTNGLPTIPAELEREVRHLRTRGPEMPGVVFYTHTWKKETDRLWDDLAYKYFISPVVTTSHANVRESAVSAMLANIGGMNAHDVRVGLFTPDGRELSRQTIPLLRAGQSLAVTLPFEEPAMDPLVKVIPAAGYTALNPAPLEVIPSVQVRGNPITIYWTPDRGRTVPSNYLVCSGPAEGKIEAGDRIEFINNDTGEVALALNDVIRTGRRDLNGNFYLQNMPTDALAPGAYRVRLIGRRKERAKAWAEVTITSPGGRFYVTEVAGNPWTGDPQEIRVKAGDTFVINWDLTGRQIPSPVVFISPPGASTLRMPGPDGGYAFAPIINIMGNGTLERGSREWKTALKDEDFFYARSATPTGWLRDGYFKKAQNPRVNMSLNRGTWQLWIGSAWSTRAGWEELSDWIQMRDIEAIGRVRSVMNGWATPKTPVIKVTVE